MLRVIMKSRHDAPILDDEAATSFFMERVPEGWFIEDVDVRFDDVEILVVGRLAVQVDGNGAAECRTAIEEHRESASPRRLRNDSSARCRGELDAGTSGCYSPISRCRR